MSVSEDADQYTLISTLFEKQFGISSKAQTMREYPAGGWPRNHKELLTNAKTRLFGIKGASLREERQGEIGEWNGGALTQIKHDTL